MYYVRTHKWLNLNHYWICGLGSKYFERSYPRTPAPIAPHQKLWHFNSTIWFTRPLKVCISFSARGIFCESQFSLIFSAVLYSTKEVFCKLKCQVRTVSCKKEKAQTVTVLSKPNLSQILTTFVFHQKQAFHDHGSIQPGGKRCNMYFKHIAPLSTITESKSDVTTWW